MIFLFLLQFHIFSQQQSCSSFQLPASASFSFHKLKHRFRSQLDLYSTSLDALHCNAVRECQADRQTDKIHEKFPNRT